MLLQKVREIKEYCEAEEIDLIIFDCELTPTQIRNIEAETDVRVIDRTTLILDILYRQLEIQCSEVILCLEHHL